jgi:predicted amidohydrolase
MELFERMAQKAAGSGTELFVTCECFLDGYCADMLRVKERFTGKDRARIEAMAPAGRQ